MIYSHNINTIKIVKIPFLEKKHFIIQINDFEIGCIDISYDKKLLNILSKKGDKMIIKKI